MQTATYWIHSGYVSSRNQLGDCDRTRLTNIVDQWFAAVFELGTTWLLIQKDGKVYKDDLRQVYDVSTYM